MSERISPTSLKFLSRQTTGEISLVNGETNLDKMMYQSSPKVTSPTARQSPLRTSSSQSASRQSMTSSQLSMATTTAECDTGSEVEPLFRGRWDDEAEMDKGLKILKRKHAAAVRLRKMHDVYDRLLDDKIRLLDTNLSNIEKELTKETRFIQEEIREFKPVLQFPRIDSATPIESRSSSRLSGRNRTDKICKSCMFDSSNTNLRCRHFPCFLPATYNSITFTTKPQTYSVVGNYNQLLQRCKDVRPSTSITRQHKKTDEETMVTESHPPRNSTKEKIRGLKQLVKEMKERNEKTKPRDWAINYGDPVPRRIILKPVKTI